jgi:uncharacterized protein YbbK (DUF523 family)
VGEPVRIGVSACLIGQEVRWDGTARPDRFLIDRLGPQVEWVPVCPEVEVGMGVPREPIDLHERQGEVRLVGASGQDSTEKMRAWAIAKLAALPQVDGFVLKTGSPSCGLNGVRLFKSGDRKPVNEGVGLFAAALRAARPNVLCVDEKELADPAKREAFLAGIAAAHKARTGA